MNINLRKLPRVENIPLALILSVSILSILAGILIGFNNNPGSFFIVLLGLSLLPIFFVLSLNGKAQMLLFSFWFGGVVLLNKPFTLLGFPNIGVYVTEIILFLLIVSILIRFLLVERNISRPFPPSLFYVLIGYWIVGLLALVRGLNPYGYWALRDSVIVFYSPFLIVAWYVIDSDYRFKKIWNLFLICATAGGVLYLANKLNFLIEGNIAIELNPSAASIVSGLAILGLLLGMVRYKSGRGNLILVFLIVFHATVLLVAEVRAAWVGFAIALILYGFKVTPGIRSRVIKLLPLLVIFILLSLIIVNVIVPFNFFSFLVDEIRSLYDYEVVTDVKGSGPNAEWRLEIWEDALKTRVSDAPILGEGFGVPQIIKNGLRTGLHNSHLAIILATGFLGYFLFLMINAIVFILSLRKYKTDSDDSKSRTLWLMTGQVYILISSFFFVALEGPFVGAFYWSLLGLVVSNVTLNSPVRNE